MTKRIVILGAGESGTGAAVLAKKQGFDTFVSDMSSIKDKYKAMLDERGIPWEEGHHTESLILNADEVIKSPGIPNNAPMILKLKEQGTPIISEIEFAGRYTNAKMICITGSNGKTTTTSLIYHIFKKAGLNVGLAGNIGQSLAYQVAECNYDYYVIELSSFQLDNMYKFHANIAVLMTSSASSRTRPITMLSSSGTMTLLSGKSCTNMVFMGNIILLPRSVKTDWRLLQNKIRCISLNLSSSIWNKKNWHLPVRITYSTPWRLAFPPTLPAFAKAASVKR